MKTNRSENPVQEQAPPTLPTGFGAPPARWPVPPIRGLDLRTWLAGQALVGILACEPISASTAARAAVRAADALIAVLAGLEPKP